MTADEQHIEKIVELYDMIYDLRYTIEELKRAVIRSGGELVRDEATGQWRVEKFL